MHDPRSDAAGAAAQGSGRPPVYLTRFVGRVDELREVTEALAGHRVLTICGAGGLGKTRLAVEIARRSRAGFPDGMVWVSLVGATDAGTTRRAIGAAVLRHSSSGVDPIASAAAAIGRRRILVVLDNCEHVAGPCSEAVHGLQAACPSLTVLTTSRVALHVPGELVYAVPPLGGERDGTAGDAVDLFVDRASQGSPGWHTSAGLDPTVHQICARLEGLPLAIELAASWIRVLSPADLLTEITSSIETLSAVGAVVADRHQSLQAVLESTWAWLGGREQDVLARLSIFVDGFSREAAEAVVGATLGALATLSERALIRRVPDASGTTRYHVHELVRVFAADKLRARHGWEDAERSHYAYFSRLVGSAQTVWDTAAEAEALARIEADQGNVEAALTRSIERRAAIDALTLAGGLFAYWIYTAPLETRRKLLDRALALPGDDADDPSVRARALNVAGYAWLYADPGRAVELFAEGVELYRRAGDPSGEAWSLRGMGYVYLVANDIETSERLNRESLQIRRAAGDRVGLAWTVYGRAEALTARRDLDRAAPLLEEALSEFSDLGIDFAVYRILILLGDVHRLHREWLPALDCYRRALDLQHRRGFTTRGGEIMEGLGSLASEVGRVDLTARLHGAAATWRRSLGTTRLGYNESDVERDYAAAQSRLPSSEWLQLFEGGRLLSFDEAEIDAGKIARDLTDWCRSAPAAHLTPREIDVLGLVAEGLSNPEIAIRLVLSPRTVHAHLRSIFDKLGVSTRTAAALKARELALGPPTS